MHYLPNKCSRAHGGGVQQSDKVMKVPFVDGVGTWLTSARLLWIIDLQGFHELECGKNPYHQQMVSEPIVVVCGMVAR
jgi:hypothetical protein